MAADPGQEDAAGGGRTQLIRWNNKATSDPVPKGRSGHAAAQLGSSILIFGGGGASVYFNDTWVLDTETLQWKEPALSGAAPSARAYHAAARVGDRVYFFGGWKGDQFLNDLHVLDGAASPNSAAGLVWSQPSIAGKPPPPRAYHTATAVGSRLFIFGGWFSTFFNELAVLDTETMTWHIQPSTGAVPAARAAHSATRVGHRLFVFGGESQSGRLNDLAILDMRTYVWHTPKMKSNVPSPRSGHTSELVSKWLVVFGGWDGDNHLSDTHYLDTEVLEWVPAPAQLLPLAAADAAAPEEIGARSGHTCSFTGKGLYIIGGWDRTAFLNDVWALELRLQPTLGSANLQGDASTVLPAAIGLDGSWDSVQQRIRDLGPKTLQQLTEWKALQTALVCKSQPDSPRVLQAVADIAAALLRVAVEAEPASLLLAPSASATSQVLPTNMHTITTQDTTLSLNLDSFKGSILPWLQPYGRPIASQESLPSGTHAPAPPVALLDVVESALKSRSFFAKADSLHSLLLREARESKSHEMDLTLTAPTIGVQPLFQLHKELMQSQESIRSFARDGDLQAAREELVRRDALHQQCMQLARDLKAELERVTASQHSRAEHVNTSTEELQSAKAALQACLLDQSQPQSHVQIQAGGRPPSSRLQAGARPFYSSTSNSYSSTSNSHKSNASSSQLGTQQQAVASLKDLDATLARYREWQGRVYLPVRPILDDTNRALLAVHESLRREASQCASVLELSGDSENAGTTTSSALAQGCVQARELIQAAEVVLGNLKAERGEIALEHTQSLLADCVSVLSKLEEIDRQRPEIEVWQRELKELSRQILAAKEAQIRLNAEIELSRLRLPSGSRELNLAEQRLSAAREEVGKLCARQDWINEKLYVLARSDHPELLCEETGELSTRLRHTGLVVNRKLADYEQVGILQGSSQHVLLVKYNGRLCVLKELPLSDESARKVFENEVTLLWKLHHPAIITVEAAFYDGLRAYIQTPYIDGGTMGQWLLKGPKPWEVQSAFRQLLQGLSYVHDHGVVHRDMKLDNVLMAKDNKPVICDLGISKDRSALLAHTTTTSRRVARRKVSTNSLLPRNPFGAAGADSGSESFLDDSSTSEGVIKGTQGYIAPEVLEGEPATPSSDMWAIGKCGVMLYKAHFGTEPVIEAGQDAVVIPEDDNEHLRQLLSALLQRNPNARPNANQALAYSYFTASFVRHLSENKQILESDLKLDLLREQVRSLQEGRSTVSVRVRRSDLIEDTLGVFSEINKEMLLHPLEVRFIGEAGRDAGGLTSDLYIDFFHKVGFIPSTIQVVDVELELFEAPSAEDGPASGTAYLPCANHGELRTYELIGKVLVKSMVDRRPIPAVFAPSSFKYLLGHEPSLRDLELYDRTLAMSLRELLVRPADGLNLFFEDELLDYVDETQGTSSEQSGSRAPVAVTDANKRQYVQHRVQYVLVGCRQRQLEAMRRGFQEVDLSSYLQVFSCTDLMLLVCGEEHVDAHMVVELIRFSPADWPTTSRTPADLLALLHELRSNDLRRFLRLATAQCTIARGTTAPITIHRIQSSDRLPVGRTCFRRVDLPDYKDAQVLQDKLLLALATLDGSGFLVS
eukprot:jgi/Chlat1/5935/Chrsp4S06260